MNLDEWEKISGILFNVALILCLVLVITIAIGMFIVMGQGFE